MKTLALWVGVPLLSGCAILHHAQVGEIDNRHMWQRERVDIKVSEIGVNIDEAADIAKSVSRNEKTQQAVGDIQSIIALFQFGPRTGNPVYTEDYARNVALTLRDACPTGRLTGVTSIRETAKYPVISGEIIRITGYCLTKKDQ